jgi:hypothetical protein
MPGEVRKLQPVPRCIDSMALERVTRLEPLLDDASFRCFNGHAMRFER